MLLLSNLANLLYIEDWGAFALKKIDEHQTRFIVRTHGQELPNMQSKISDFFGMTAHYISTFWLLTFMIFDPKPVFSLLLLLIITLTFVWL